MQLHFFEVQMFDECIFISSTAHLLNPEKQIFKNNVKKKK